MLARSVRPPCFVLNTPRALYLHFALHPPLLYFHLPLRPLLRLSTPAGTFCDPRGVLKKGFRRVEPIIVPPTKDALFMFSSLGDGTIVCSGTGGKPRGSRVCHGFCEIQSFATNRPTCVILIFNLGTSQESPSKKPHSHKSKFGKLNATHSLCLPN